MAQAAVDHAQLAALGRDVDALIQEFPDCPTAVLEQFGVDPRAAVEAVDEWVRRLLLHLHFDSDDDEAMWVDATIACVLRGLLAGCLLSRRITQSRG